ncbi:hypothetical protein HY488_00515 [Candidatus Woesearchaeota archaeon]|nr:hypothetical protein [Candidatus Woesearchaeota archaeon]
MKEKEGAFTVFVLLTVLSVLLFGCTLVKRPDIFPETTEIGTIQPENLAENGSSASATKCDDSQDGGNNPSVQGILRVTYNAKVTSLTDTCNNQDYLTEYYCDGKEYRYYKKLCTYGCRDGACLSTMPDQQPVMEQPALLPEGEQVEQEEAPAAIPECFNGFRDLQETDMDCGGPNCKPCGYGKHCKLKRDCVAPLSCNVRSFLCLSVAH